MHWNYRAIKHMDAIGITYSVHEVFYDDNNKPSGCTSEPVSFTSHTPELLINVLEQAIRDLKARPVFEPPAEWNDPNPDVCPFCKQEK